MVAPKKWRAPGVEPPTLNQVFRENVGTLPKSDRLSDVKNIANKVKSKFSLLIRVFLYVVILMVLIPSRSFVRHGHLI